MDSLGVAAVLRREGEVVWANDVARSLVARAVGVGHGGAATDAQLAEVLQVETSAPVRGQATVSATVTVEGASLAEPRGTVLGVATDSEQLEELVLFRPDLVPNQVGVGAGHEPTATGRVLEAVVADIDDVVVILDATLAVRWASPGIERLVDAPAYTNVGESAFNDIHPDDFPRLAMAVEEVMTQPGRRARVGFRIQHARRGWRSVEASIVNRLDDPAIEGLVCTLRDVTEHRDSDAELRRLREQDRDEVLQLREADQLKDAFLATVSHELRTPLTAVRGFSAYLMDGGADLDTETARSLVERIAVNARDMEDMIAQLLDYSRLQAGSVAIEAQRLALGPVVRAMVERLEPHLHEHRVVCGECDFDVLADRDATGHVLRNLLTNAARYSPAGSTIWVEAERGDGEILLHVTDAGIGIAPEDQGRVFQSFYQAAPASAGRRGTGIGLNVARRFAQIQGGRLGLESQPGKGSTFTLVLPALD